MTSPFSLTLPRGIVNGAMAPETLLNIGWIVLLQRYTLSDTITFEQISDAGKLLKSTLLEPNTNGTLGELVRDVEASKQDGVDTPAVYKLYGLGNSTILQILLSTYWDESEENPFTHIDEHLKTAGSCIATIKDGIDTTSVSYRSELYGALLNMNGASKILAQFRDLLPRIGESSLDTTVGEIFRISPQEISQILSWNSSGVNLVGSLVHEIIEDQVRKDPEAMAVCAWDGEMTYAQLWEESSEMAGQLIHHGVCLETLVPFCLEKSVWTIVAMLAILRAGGAFVPLDPSHPRSRLEYIVRTVRAKFIITSAKLASLCDSLADKQLLVEQLSAKQSIVPPVAEPFQTNEIGLSNLAYVLFTSGSTGPPKGVLVEHSQLSTSAINIGKFADFGSQTRLLNFAAYSFDACLLEIMCALVNGGCVCVPSDQDRLDDIVGVMNRMRVTGTLLTPSFLSVLRPAELETIDTIIAGGEKVPLHLMELWTPSICLMGGYGPTECCIVCLMADYGVDKEDGMIGTTVSGRAWIVEPENHDILAPIGAIGELILEGPMVGRGYLDDDAKSAKVFIKAPSWAWNIAAGEQDHKRRFYKTGDLARYDSNGNIIYLRRKDTQVKLRGQRFELGEVEHYLHCYVPLELQVAAEVVAGPGGTQVLAALISSTSRMQVNGTATFDSEEHLLPVVTPFLGELDQRLREALPSYMVPSIYIPVPCMYLTVSGKLDRRWLQEFASGPMARPITASLSLASKETMLSRVELTDTEARLQALWAKWLKMDAGSISLDDNFFHLGGNSIIAIHMAAEARKSQTIIRVDDMFKYPTLLDMATKSKPANFDTLAPIAPLSLLQGEAERENLMHVAGRLCSITVDMIEDMYPCTPSQVFFMDVTTHFTDCRDGPTGLADQIIYRATSDCDLDKFRTAWDYVAMKYGILRTRIIHDSNRHYQVVIREPISWGFTDDLNGYLVEDKAKPFVFGDRLTRFALVTDQGTTEVYFVLTLQHASYDAWMLSLVWKEVGRVYSNVVGTTTTARYNAFIKHMMTIDCVASSRFWGKHLNGAICKPIESPGTLLDSTYRPNASASHHIPFKAVNNSKFGVTLSTIIYGALAVLLGSCTNSPDFVFHLVRNGRNCPVPGIEDIAGPLLTRHPLRVRLGGHQTIEEFLRKIQTDLTEMTEFQLMSWSAIRQLSAEAEQACKSACIVNVLRYEGSEEAERSVGLEFESVGKFSLLPVAFWMQCRVAVDELQPIAMYEPSCISYSGCGGFAASIRSIIIENDAGKPWRQN